MLNTTSKLLILISFLICNSASLAESYTEPKNVKENRLKILESERAGILERLNRYIEDAISNPNDASLKKQIHRFRTYLSMIDSEIKIANNHIPAYYKETADAGRVDIASAKKTIKRRDIVNTTSLEEPTRVANQTNSKTPNSWDVFNEF